MGVKKHVFVFLLFFLSTISIILCKVCCFIFFLILLHPFWDYFSTPTPRGLQMLFYLPTHRPIVTPAMSPSCNIRSMTHTANMTIFIMPCRLYSHYMQLYKYEQYKKKTNHQNGICTTTNNNSSYMCC